jgi:hypothetical protein
VEDPQPEDLLFTSLPPSKDINKSKFTKDRGVKTKQFALAYFCLKESVL